MPLQSLYFLDLVYPFARRIGYRSRDPHVAASRMTETDVRISAHVHNAVSITFVHQISLYPKPHSFGQVNAEQDSRCLACFKFRFLKGPQTKKCRAAHGLNLARTAEGRYRTKYTVQWVRARNWASFRYMGIFLAKPQIHSRL